MNSPRFISRLLQTISLLVVLWTLGFFVTNYRSPTFLEGAMGNLFATLLGVLIAIPIALQVAAIEQRGSEQAAQRAASAHARSRKQSMLAQLRRELASATAQVNECRIPMKTGGQRDIITNPLRYELWAAYSDSGDLQYVDNPDLLASLAEAFHRVKATARMERLLVEMVHFPGLRMANSRSLDKTILEYITNDDPHLLATIDRTIKAIDAELSLLSP